MAKKNTGSSKATPLTSKQIENEAYKVIRGEYGNGDARKKALGSNYDAIQSRVNEISKASGGAKNVKAPTANSSSQKNTSSSVKGSAPTTTTSSNVKSSEARKENIRTSSTANPNRVNKSTRKSNNVDLTIPVNSTPIAPNKGDKIEVKEILNDTSKNANKGNSGVVKTLTKSSPNSIVLAKADGTTKKVETKNLPRLNTKATTSVKLSDEDYKTLNKYADNMGAGELMSNYMQKIPQLKDLGKKYGVSDKELVEVYKQNKADKDVEYGKNHPILATLDSVLRRSAQTPIENALKVATGTVNPELLERTNRNNGESLIDSRIKNNREGVKTNMSNAGKGIYDVGTGIADRIGAQSVGRALSGGNQIVGAAFSGANTAGDYMDEAQNRGIDTRKSALTGLVNGGVDALLDVKGLEKIKALKGTGKIASDLAKKFAIGGGEQGITYLVQETIDNLLNGEDSVYSNNRQNYLAQGLSESEATEQALKDEVIEGIKQVGIGGGFGVGMDAVGKGARNIINSLPRITTPDVKPTTETRKIPTTRAVNGQTDPIPPTSMTTSRERDFSQNLPQGKANVNKVPTMQELIALRNYNPSGNELTISNIPPSYRVDSEPNGKVSKTRTNTMPNSGIVTDAEMQKYSPENMFTYNEVSEKESVAQALDLIRNNTPQKTASDLLNKKGLTGVETDALMTLWDSAVSRAQELDRQGYDSAEQWNLANQIFKKVQTEASRNGQAVQALAKWSRTTPTGMLAEAERIINSANTKGTKSDLQKEMEKFTGKNTVDLDPDFTKQFLNIAGAMQGLDPNSQQAKYYMAQLGRLVNTKLPSTLSERLVTGLMDNMLGNFRTLITRNAGGNVGYNIMEQIKKPIAATIDKGLSKVTGKRTTAGLSKEGLSAYLEGFGNGIKEEVADFKSGLHTARSGENDLGTAVANNRHVYIDKGSMLPDGVWNTISENKAAKLASKVLDKADALVHHGLSVGDRPFYEGTYAQTLQEYRDLRQRGVMGSVIQSLSDDEFENYAQAAAKINALAAVYQDDSALAKGLMKGKEAISDISRGVLGVDVLSQFAMPFVKTPANLVTRSIEYSPFGVVKNAVNTVREGVEKDANGKAHFNAEGLDQSRIANETARNILGTGLWAGALGLASNGNLTGAYSDDKDMKQAQKNAGMQEYALTNGNTDMDISWIPVLGNNLVAGASAYDTVKNDPDANPLTVGTKAGLKSLLDQSVFQGMQELFGGNSQFNNEQGIVENVADTVKEGVTQAVPSLMRQVGQVIDPYERNLGDGDNPYWKNSLYSSIPWLRTKLPQKIDTEGNEVLQNQGRGTASKILEDMILPGKLTQHIPSKVNDEAMRIFTEDGVNNAFITKPEKKDLGDNFSDQAFVDYSKEVGKGKADVGSMLIDSDIYKSLTDTEKADLLNTAYKGVKGSVVKKYNDASNGDSKEIRAYDTGGARGLADYLINKLSTNKEASDMGYLKADGTVNVDTYNKISSMFGGDNEAIKTYGDVSSSYQKENGESFVKANDVDTIKYLMDRNMSDDMKGKMLYATKGNAAKEIQNAIDNGDYASYWKYYVNKNSKDLESTSSNVKTVPSPQNLSNSASSKMIQANVDRMNAEKEQIESKDISEYVSSTSNGGKRFEQKEGLPMLDKMYKTDAEKSQAILDSGVSTKGVKNTINTFGEDAVYTYYKYKEGADTDGNGYVKKDELTTYLKSIGMSDSEIAKWWSVFKK